MKLLTLTHAEYLDMFRGSAIRRAKVWMLRRNAAVALGNVGGPDAIQPLADSLQCDDNGVVRGHAAWALGHLGKRTAIPVRDLLEDALVGEADRSVREEIAAALT
jgi:epoxyqueuosine reductase